MSTTQNVRPVVNTVLTDAARHAARFNSSSTALFTAQSEFTALYDAWRARAGRVEGPVDIAIKHILMQVSWTLVYGAKDAQQAFAEIAGLAALAAQVAAPAAGSAEDVAQDMAQDLVQDIRARARTLAPNQSAISTAISTEVRAAS